MDWYCAAKKGLTTVEGRTRLSEEVVNAELVGGWDVGGGCFSEDRLPKRGSLDGREMPDVPLDLFKNKCVSCPDIVQVL